MVYGENDFLINGRRQAVTQVPMLFLPTKFESTGAQLSSLFAPAG